MNQHWWHNYIPHHRDEIRWKKTYVMTMSERVTNHHINNIWIESLVRFIDVLDVVNEYKKSLNEWNELKWMRMNMWKRCVCDIIMDNNNKSCHYQFVTRFSTHIFFVMGEKKCFFCVFWSIKYVFRFQIFFFFVSFSFVVCVWISFRHKHRYWKERDRDRERKKE